MLIESEEKTPIKTIKFPKIFFGWWTVLATAIVGFLGSGFVTMGLAVLFKPIASELGLSRAVTSIAASAQSVGNGIWGPTGGMVSDKYGPRRVLLTGVFLLSLGLILMYFVNSLWSLLLVWGLVIGTGFSLGCTIITDKAIVNWFIKKSGIALNTKFAIQSLAGLLLLPLIAWLIKTQGWRMTCLIGGIAIALIGFPVIWFLIKPHPAEYYGLLPDGERKKPQDINVNQTMGNTENVTDTIALTGFTLKQTMKTPTYWLMISLGYIGGLAMPLMSVHCVNFITDRGIDPVQAASMMGLMTTVSIPIRLAIGFIVDRVKTNHLRFLMTLGYFLQVMGIGAFLISDSIMMLYIGLLVYGIGGGTSFSVQLPMWARYFGRKAFGSILGSWTMLNIPIGLISPIYVGWIYDRTGSYTSIFSLLAILLAVCTVVTCFILPPKPPPQTINVPKPKLR